MMSVLWLVQVRMRYQRDFDLLHGVEKIQNREMKTVARKLLIYFGDIPLTSLLNGYVPAAIWFPIVANIMDAPAKNLAGRLSNLAITAGRYHWNSPQI